MERMVKLDCIKQGDVFVTTDKKYICISLRGCLEDFQYIKVSGRYEKQHSPRKELCLKFLLDSKAGKKIGKSIYDNDLRLEYLINYLPDIDMCLPDWNTKIFNEVSQALNMGLPLVENDEDLDKYSEYFMYNRDDSLVSFDSLDSDYPDGDYEVLYHIEAKPFLLFENEKIKVSIRF